MQLRARVKPHSLLMAQRYTETVGAILVESANAYVKLSHQWMVNVIKVVIMDTISTNIQV